MKNIILIALFIVSLNATDCTCERGNTFWEISSETDTKIGGATKYGHTKYTQSEIDDILEATEEREICYEESGNRFRSSYRILGKKLRWTDKRGGDGAKKDQIVAWHISGTNETINTIYQCCNEDDEHYDIDITFWKRSSLPSFNSCQEHIPEKSLNELCNEIGGMVKAEQKEDCCTISSCYIDINQTDVPEDNNTEPCTPLEDEIYDSSLDECGVCDNGKHPNETQTECIGDCASDYTWDARKQECVTNDCPYTYTCWYASVCSEEGVVGYGCINIYHVENCLGEELEDIKVDENFNCETNPHDNPTEPTDDTTSNGDDNTTEEPTDDTTDSNTDDNTTTPPPNTDDNTTDDTTEPNTDDNTTEPIDDTTDSTTDDTTTDTGTNDSDMNSSGSEEEGEIGRIYGGLLSDARGVITNYNPSISFDLPAGSCADIDLDLTAIGMGTKSIDIASYMALLSTIRPIIMFVAVLSAVIIVLSTI